MMYNLGVTITWCEADGGGGVEICERRVGGGVLKGIGNFKSVQPLLELCFCLCGLLMTFFCFFDKTMTKKDKEKN